MTRRNSNSKSERMRWIATHKLQLRKTLEQVRSIEGDLSSDLLAAQRGYRRQFSRKFRSTTKAALVKKLEDSDLVLSGDFHSFAQSQRMHLRLLRSLRKNNWALLLEIFKPSDQSWIDRFQIGELSVHELFAKTKFEKRWGFEPSGYQDLLEFAKSKRIPIFGVNNESHQGSLERREEGVAKNILALGKSLSYSKKFFVVFGDFHLAKNGLAKKIEVEYRKKIKKTPRLTTVFQNEEKVYWWLVNSRLEDKIDVVQVGPKCFCIVNSSPWIKWESHLRHLELRGGSVTDQSLDQMNEIIEFQRRIIGVKSEVEYEVFEPPSSKFLKRLSSKDKSRAKLLIANHKSVFIPELHLVYLSDSKVNHMAEASFRVIHETLAQYQKTFWNFPKDFYQCVWIEAVAFFGSLVVNHRRKSATLEDVREQTKLLDHGARVALLVLESKLKQEKGVKGLGLQLPAKDSKRTWWEYFRSAQILGAQMGIKIYSGLKTGAIDSKEIVSWLQTPVEHGLRFDRFYLDRVRELKKYPQLFDSKNARL